MAHRYSCGCLFNNINTNNRFIMANREKFLHNINKAKRQREIKKEMELFEKKFLKTFDPFNTSNLKEDA
jgi:hypothetical protein